jgi:cytochrome b pre-mRNA-processing protein 3
MAQVRALPGASALSFLARLFGPPRDRLALRPLYDAVVDRAREPAWYREGAVPDTIDGRFDMVAAVLALVLLRFDREGEAAAQESALLTEMFIDDMDATMRELGIGDVVVGKRVGKLLGALGGRMVRFRDAVGTGGDFEAAVARNVFRDAPPSQQALAFVASRLRAFAAALGDAAVSDLAEGRLP